MRKGGVVKAVGGEAPVLTNSDGLGPSVGRGVAATTATWSASCKPLVSTGTRLSIAIANSAHDGRFGVGFPF
jgi:hypothetical protein